MKTIKLKCGHVWQGTKPLRFESASAIIENPCEHHLGREIKVRASHFAPSLKTLEKWSYDGVAKATDGCRVEPDGVCPHGNPSWLLVMGVI